jgi:uracil-DNA glycosylase family 4
MDDKRMEDSFSEHDTVARLVQQVRSLLRYQGELGWRGLENAPEILLRRSVAPVPKSAERADLKVAETPGAQDSQASNRKPKGSLQTVRQDLGDCRRCKLHQGRTHIVFGVGPAEARLMLIGEGPGREEDLQGEPFVGAAGQLLDKMISAMGLARREVYIANVVKCRPPLNRDPEPDEVEACRVFLDAQIAAVAPQVMVTLGKHAAHSLLTCTTPMTRLRGQWGEYRGIPVMPTFHPAYLLRNPADKKLVWSDLKQVMKRLGLERPKNA